MRGKIDLVFRIRPAASRHPGQGHPIAARAGGLVGVGIQNATAQVIDDQKRPGGHAGQIGRRAQGVEAAIHHAKLQGVVETRHPGGRAGERTAPRLGAVAAAGIQVQIFEQHGAAGIGDAHAIGQRRLQVAAHPAQGQIGGVAEGAAPAAVHINLQRRLDKAGGNHRQHCGDQHHGDQFDQGEPATSAPAWLRADWAHIRYESC